MAKEWWQTFFDENYIRGWNRAGLLSHTRREVNFLEKIIPLRKNDEILDLCCGHGRHSIELARRGYSVTGLDFSAYEIGLARKGMKDRGLVVDFRIGDARSFKFSKKFDVIVNMFTSFGYGTKEDDFKIIRNVSRALKRGGKFFIDTQSLPYLLGNFQILKKQKFDSVKVIERRSYNFLEDVLYNTRTIFDGKRKKVYKSQLREYTLAGLGDLLEKNRLKMIKFFGSYRGDPFGFKQKRMLVLAKKV